MSRKYVGVEDHQPFAEILAEVCLATEGNSALAHVNQALFDMMSTAVGGINAVSSPEKTQSILAEFAQ